MSGFFRTFAFLLALAVAVGIGAAVYNAGVTAGLDEAARQAAASGDAIPVPWGYGYGPYWHGPFGFGLFGPILLVFGLFVVIGFVNIAVRGGRHGGPGRGGWGDRRGRLEEWHRELHGRDVGEEPQRSAGT